MRASRGTRRGTRKKLSRRSGTKIIIGAFLKSFRPNDRVIISPNPSKQKGMPHSKFYGLAGTVKEKRGNAYVIEVIVGNKPKTITARPEHLRLVSSMSHSKTKQINA